MLLTPILNGLHAEAEADRAHLFGMQGYLVTITSDAENNFLLYQMTGATWLGGSDFFANESDWYWMTGPEAGTMFWQGEEGGSGNDLCELESRLGAK